MLKVRLWSLALAGVVSLPAFVRAQYADAVLAYTPGAGVTLTNPVATLGAPTPTANPFSPAFSGSQLVSIGAGGSLTLHLSQSIMNDPSHPFGIDFVVFGNSFLTVTNGNFSGGGITSGVLGGNNTGMTQVAVSPDNVTWYRLASPALPTVDSLYATDGKYNAQAPVNPGLVASNFAGLGLGGIHALYTNSAGGSGFDLAWAVDTNGNPVTVTNANYVRIEVLSGKSEVDAVSLVSSPTVWPVGAVSLLESFAADPAKNGWKMAGNTNLFKWDSTNQNLRVTWDGSQPNSYFYHPLGTVLARDDDFSLVFDLRLSDIAGGVVSNTGPFQIAVGFINLAQATNGAFSRGTGFDSPNVAEFDYFPAGDIPFFGPVEATVSPTLISSNNQFASGFTYPLELTTNTWFHVSISYTARDHTMRTLLLRDGVPYGPVQDAVLGASFTDVRLDTVAVDGYTADPFDSVLAHGVIDNLVVTTPPAPVQGFAAGFVNHAWQAQSYTRTNWLYTLERTANFSLWENAGAPAMGNGGLLMFPDTNSPAPNAFYRLRATRP